MTSAAVGYLYWIVPKTEEVFEVRKIWGLHVAVLAVISFFWTSAGWADPESIRIGVVLWG